VEEKTRMATRLRARQGMKKWHEESLSEDTRIFDLVAKKRM
jgi:hypothetical protein